MSREIEVWSSFATNGVFYNLFLISSLHGDNAWENKKDCLFRRSSTSTKKVTQRRKMPLGVTPSPSPNIMMPTILQHQGQHQVSQCYSHNTWLDLWRKRTISKCNSKKKKKIVPFSLSAQCKKRGCRWPPMRALFHITSEIGKPLIWSCVELFAPI